VSNRWSGPAPRPSEVATTGDLRAPWAERCFVARSGGGPGSRTAARRSRPSGRVQRLNSMRVLKVEREEPNGALRCRVMDDNSNGARCEALSDGWSYVDDGCARDAVDAGQGLVNAPHPGWPARSDCGPRARVTGSTTVPIDPFKSVDGVVQPTDPWRLSRGVVRMAAPHPVAHRAAKGWPQESEGVVCDSLAEPGAEPISTFADVGPGSSRAPLGGLGRAGPRSGPCRSPPRHRAGGRRSPGHGNPARRPSR